MPSYETKLHDLPDRFVTDRTTSTARGPPWLVPAGRKPAGQAPPVQPGTRLVTVMLPVVPAWAPDRVGVGRESGSDRNRPSDGKQAGCAPGAGAWRLVLAGRVAPS